MPPYSLLKSVAVGLCMAFFVAACATTPDTFSSSAPGKDFSTIKTFGFLSQPSTDQPGYESLETNFLKVAVAQEMDRRGVRYDPMNPDVLMNFYIRTEQKIKSRQVPSASGGYYGYRSGFYGGYAGYETHIEQYTVGTLTIDMIDPKERKLVWEGTVTGRLTKKDVRNLEETMDRAVKDIFERFPIAAAPR